MDNKEIMKKCKEEADWTMKRGMGGPFGRSFDYYFCCVSGRNI